MIERDDLSHTVVSHFWPEEICNAVNIHWLINCPTFGWLRF